MEIKSFKVVKRIPTEQYGFYEIEVNGVLNKSDCLREAVESIRNSLDGRKEVAVVSDAAEVKTKVAKKKATVVKKKEPAKERVPKHLLYDRSKEQHKREFVGILSTYDTDWDKKKEVAKSVGAISQKLVGTQIYDKDGELLGSFTDAVIDGVWPE